jgi:hypothetical protein
MIQGERQEDLNFEIPLPDASFVDLSILRFAGLEYLPFGRATIRNTTLSMESTTYASLSKDGDSKCLAAPLSVPEVTEPTRHPTNASNAPVRRLGKAAFTKTNLLVGATALALTTLCYRYVRYTALKELRDDCRAVAVSSIFPLLTVLLPYSTLY